MAEDDLLTSTEVARLLGVNVRTVHRLAERGTLPVAHRLRGRNGLLFRLADVATYKEQAA